MKMLVCELNKNSITDGCNMRVVTLSKIDKFDEHVAKHHNIVGFEVKMNYFIVSNIP